MVKLILLTFILSCSTGFSVTGVEKQPFQSKKAPAEIVKSYEVVLPRVTYIGGEELLVVVPADTNGSNFTLKLELNRGLLAPHFTSRSYSRDGKEIVTKGHKNCFYHGQVVDHPGWTAVVSTCQGLRGSFGEPSNSAKHYHLEPLNHSNKSLEQPHALYLDLEYSGNDGTCGSESLTREKIPKWEEEGTLSQARVTEKLRRQSSKLLIVEWVVLNDLRQYQLYDENIELTVLRTIEVANYVDVLYRTLNIHVVLVDVITWTNGDLIEVVSDADTLLMNVRSYQPMIETPHDGTLLLTSIDLNGNTIGKAYLGKMCDDTRSVAVTEDSGRSLERVASTAAHELGHNFNMQHDDSPRECNCQDASGVCLMSAKAKSPDPTKWSDCSEHELQEGFLVMDLGRCLTNEPVMTVTGSICGNGIQEGDEICDCGSLEVCQDPCCDALTCGLRKDAECHSGQPCCQSNCQFSRYGTTCREPIDECDIEEYCTGDSADCPTETHLQDATECNGNESFCFSGFCQTYDAQCELYFGSGSQMAVEDCYTQLNVQGTESGHCGYTATQFVACDESDALCGQLHCTAGDFMSTEELEGTVTLITTSDGSTEECHSFTTLPGLDFDIDSPGLVQDGARCDHGKLCYEQQCMSIEELDYIWPCNKGTSDIICSGRGKCNNHNQCSCDIGFTGSACELLLHNSKTKGSGKDSESVVGIIAAVLLGIVAIVAVAVGVICLIRQRKSQPRSKRKKTTKSRPSVGSGRRMHRANADKPTESTTPLNNQSAPARLTHPPTGPPLQRLYNPPSQEPPLPSQNHHCITRHTHALQPREQESPPSKNQQSSERKQTTLGNPIARPDAHHSATQKPTASMPAHYRSGMQPVNYANLRNETVANYPNPQLFVQEEV